VPSEQTGPVSVVQMRRAPTHPGEIFRLEFREAADPPISQAEAARRLRIPVNRLNELERGKRGVTPRTAILLGALTNTTPEFWMNLQARYELWHALKEIGTPKIKPIEVATAR
jgi:addiction module HigA family antidote